MTRSKHTPEQREAWRELRRVKPGWRLLYGWRLVPIFRKSGAKSGIIGYRKQFSHLSGALILGSPRGTKQEGGHYIVWGDQSLRGVTSQAFDLLAKVPPVARVAMLKGEKTLKDAA